ncbi:hypothetical protein [Vulcanococcus limneticus]|uniref:hypothetical protein n=1 Tax=Vulcanococcus limneticus TaxID=2170428 RepID=UPI0034EB063E
MADPRQHPASSGSGLLLSALGGAVLGAAGLGWWLLSEADRRRQSRLPQPLRLRAPRQSAAPADLEPQAAFQPTSAASAVDPLLQERVQQLNKAIDEVRRQLEQLQPLP